MSPTEKQAFKATLICLALMIAGKVTETAGFNGYPLLFLAAIVIGGFKQTKEGILELFQSKTLNVDLLMALAAIGACLIGNYFEGAMLTFIFCLSGALEEYATNKSTKEISALMALNPTTALKMIDGKQVEVDVTKLERDDQVFVPKGSEVPIDGILLIGETSIDEAAISGESIPVEKKAGAELFSGTINLGQAFTMRVTKKADETLFAQIIKLVEEAQQNQGKIASFIERIENTYVKVVLAAVPLMILVFYFGLGWSFTESFYRGMVMLVVASPCALVASVTPATLAAISNGAKKGILFKSGEYLERLADLKAIAFDKTGTLTRGKPQVVNVKMLTNDTDVLPILFAMEQQSTHPLAKAVTQFFANEAITPLSDLVVEEIAGFGLETTYAGSRWVLGKHAFDPTNDPIAKAEQTTVEQFNAQGKTVIFLARDQQLVAYLALMDQPKKNAAQLIAYFKQAGIKTLMLTGDNHGSAQYVAQKIGLDDFKASLLPQDKTKIVKAEKQRYEVNAMVGDGINDAPALANAEIGIAMGEGTDIAMDVSDMVVMQSELSKIIYAHRLALKLKKIVRQNIFFSLTVIILLLLSNFAQFLSLPLGVIGHEGSTILVILNGLRLLIPLKEPTDDRPAKCAKCPLYQLQV